MATSVWTSGRGLKVLIFTGLAVVIIIGILSLNSILAPIIARKIKAAVLKSSDSTYYINFRKISVNVFSGSAEIDDIKLINDTLHGHSASQSIAGTAGTLRISGANLLAYLFHKRLEIGQITLSEPVLSYTQYKVPKVKHQDKRTLYQKISGKLKSISVGNITLDHARLTYSDYSAAKSTIEHLKDLNFSAIALLIDSSTQKDTTRTLFCRDILTYLKDFNGFSDDGLYHYSLGSAHFSTRTGKLVFRGILVKPLLVSTFFTKSRADRFSFGMDSLVLDRFLYRDFLLDHYLDVNKISGFNGHIGVFGSPDSKLQTNDRVITFPHYIIRSLSTHFSVDTLDLFGLLVSYSELNKKSGKTGILEFKGTNARFLHISNEAEKLKNQPLCTAQISSLFMGQGKLNVAFTFNLTDRDYSFKYQGHLAAMPLVAINPVVMPLALVQIKNGQLKSLDFTIDADQHKSTGTLHLLYNDLNVDLLNANYHNNVLKTLAVNALVIKHNNPDKDGDAARFAKVIFLRPKSYPFFKTLWQTLFSGLKPCAGIGYAVGKEADKSLSQQEQKANGKSLKKAIKAKNDADKTFQNKIKK